MTEPYDDLSNLEPETDDEVSQGLLAWAASSGPQLRRHHRSQSHNPTTTKLIVFESYSQLRVAKLISEFRPKHVMQGFAFDRTTVDKDDGSHWEFSLESKRHKARVLLCELGPYLLLALPMCTQFS